MKIRGNTVGTTMNPHAVAERINGGLEYRLGKIQTELEGIRVGVDETFPTAGEAVRQQFEKVIGDTQSIQFQIDDARYYGGDEGYDTLAEAIKIPVKDLRKSVGALEIVNEASGSTITIKDSSNRELRGLTLYGTEKTASAESVAVKVMGKNIADVRKFSTSSTIKTPTSDTTLTGDYGTTIEVNGKSAVITQSKCGAPTDTTSFFNGYFTVGFYCPLRVGDIVRASFKYDITDNPLNDTRIASYISDKQAKTMSLTNNIYSVTYTITEDTKSVDGWNYMTFRNGGKSGVFSNFQIEYGSAYTGFEEYKEPQTLVVPTPNGLQTGEVLGVEEASNLHTYKPNTTIINDCGAEMSVEYLADTKTYIDNKFTELQNAILASGANV